MKQHIREALINRGWEIEPKGENDTWFNVLNGTLAFVTFYENGLGYKLKGFMDMYIPYSDVAKITENQLVLQMGTLLIGDK